MLSAHAHIAMHALTAAALWPCTIVTGVYGSRASDQIVRDVLQSVHIVAFNLTVFQSCAVASLYLSRVMTHSNVTFLYRSYVQGLLAVVMSMSVSMAYWFAAFHPHICESEGVCDVLSGVYYSYLVFLGAAGLLQCIALLLFAYTYITYRYKNWDRMQELESLFEFHPALSDGESCRDVPKFINHWTRLTSSDIIGKLRDRSAEVMDAITQDLDTDRDGVVSMREFVKFAASHNLVDPVKVERLWQILSAPSLTAITRAGVESALYDLSFYRQRLALLLLTDSKVVRWAMMYLSALFFSCSGVIAMTILGYDTFGSGLDLFKVYLAIVTYSITKMSSSISFIDTMIRSRPFNLGDILLLDASQTGVDTRGVGSNFFQVTGITPRYTTVSGCFPVQLPNSVVTSRSIRNVSNSPMNDAIFIDVPLCTSDDLLARVNRALFEYALQHPYEIECKSLARNLVWGRVCNKHKTLEAYWTYSQIVQDCSYAKAMMFKVRNAVVQTIWKEVREDLLVGMSAQGGAFNAQAAGKFKLE